jgi:hypothetical protein
MELIVDKKGADMDTFKKIRAELEQMRVQPSAGAKKPAPTPPLEPAETKRQRVG